MGVKRTGTVTGSSAMDESFSTSFDRDKFEKRLKDHGHCVTWEKAIRCPYLRGPSPLDHDVNCRVCAHGYVYYDSCETKMLVQAIALDENYYAYGRYDTGKATITALPEQKVSFWDRITLNDSRSRYTEYIFRQPDTLVDKLRYTALSVDRLVWAGRERELVTYTEGVEFTLNDDGELVWADDVNRPDDRSTYTIVYFHRPQYLVIDLLHHVRDMRVELAGKEVMQEFPVQVMAQMDFSVRDESLDNAHEDVRQSSPFPNRRQGG